MNVEQTAYIKRISKTQTKRILINQKQSESKTNLIRGFYAFTPAESIAVNLNHILCQTRSTKTEIYNVISKLSNNNDHIYTQLDCDLNRLLNVPINYFIVNPTHDPRQSSL